MHPGSAPSDTWSNLDPRPKHSSSPALHAGITLIASQRPHSQPRLQTLIFSPHPTPTRIAPQLHSTCRAVRRTSHPVSGTNNARHAHTQARLLKTTPPIPCRTCTALHSSAPIIANLESNSSTFSFGSQRALTISRAPTKRRSHYDRFAGLASYQKSIDLFGTR